MATPTFQSFGNNLVVKKADYRLQGIFTDENHLLKLFGDDIRSTHMGVLSAWNQMSLVSTPLISMTELQRNTIYLNGDDGEMTFEMPYTLDGVTVKEDLTTDVEFPGRDGQSFELLLGDGGLEPTFQVNTRITPDYQDGQNLIVVGVNNAPLGSGFVYTLKLITSNRDEYFDKKYCNVGTQFFRLSGTVGEFTEHFAGIDNSFGMMILKHQIGGRRGVEYSISGNAQRLKLSVDKAKGTGNSFVTGASHMLTPNDPSLYTVIGQGQVDGAGKPVMGVDGKQAIKPGTISWAYTAEMLVMQQLTLDEERDLMWARGGVIQGAGNKSQIVGEGLYNQMKKGNWRKLPRYSRQALMDVFGQVFMNRPDIPDTERYFEIQGGRGAVQEIQKIFEQELNRTANQGGFIINATEVGAVTNLGSTNGIANLGVGYKVQKCFISGYGTLTIKHNPAFDSSYSRTEDTPYIGGLSKHSYTSAIFDVTNSESTNAAKVTSQVEFAKGMDTGANVYMVRNQAFPGNKVTYINGRTSPHGVSAGNGQVASHRKDEYTIMIENQSNVWLKDPTRSILLELSGY